VDGQDFGNPITAGSCRASWDSTQAADGLHTVQAIGRDEFNNPLTSQAVTVRVNNFVPPEPPPTTPPPTTPPPIAPPPAPPAPPTTTPAVNGVTILFPAPNAVVQGTVPVSVAIPAGTESFFVELKDIWGATRGTWSLPLSAIATLTTVQVNAPIGNVPPANYSLVATAVVNGVPVVSIPVPVRVENTTATPPTPTPPTTPAPPTNPGPTSSVMILSPSGNALLQGIVPVFVAVPAHTEAIFVELKDVWGGTRGTWAIPVTPSGSAATVQVSVATGTVPNANYSVVATAIVNGVAVSSAPVPVRVENTIATPPTSPAPQAPGAGRAPSRTKSPTAAAVPDPTAGGTRPRPEAQPAGERAGVRTSSTTASQAKAGSKSLIGSSKAQKSTAPASAKGTSLPAGTIVTIGLGPCSGTDPYAKHPTLKGECVSGTWFPRVRKAEPRRQQ
jgi:hypothetical protein